MLIYCDSVILIYYLDAVGAFHYRADRRLTSVWTNGDRIAVSELTRLECRIKPIRFNDSPLLARFDVFFGLPDVQLVPLTRSVYERATVVRAKYRFKTMDAIHLAAGVEASCDIFLTNDLRLSAFPDITVEVLP